MPESLILYKKEKSKFRAPAVLSLFPIILVLGIIYGGLFFYEEQLKKENQKVTADINELKSKRRISEEDTVKIFDKQLNALSDILNKVNYGSGFFTALEKIILPETSLKNAFVDINNNSATIKGYVKNYSELSAQIAAFLVSNDIISEEISGVDVDTDGFINFEFKLIFKPNVFK